MENNNQTGCATNETDVHITSFVNSYYLQTVGQARDFMALGLESDMDIGWCDDDVSGSDVSDSTCNSDGKEMSDVSPVFLRDKCTRLLGLMQCLTFVVDADFKAYTFNPHHDLIMTIEDIIKEIDEGLKQL